MGQGRLDDPGLQDSRQERPWRLIRVPESGSIGRGMILLTGLWPREKEGSHLRAGFIIRMPERISTAEEARRFVGYGPNQSHPHVLHIVTAIMMGIWTFMKAWRS